MATIHIARNQQTLGSFGEEEIREGIRTGRFTAKDLVWRVGMDSWKPLSEMAPLWGLDTPPPPLEAIPAEAVAVIPETDGGGPAWEEREKIGFLEAISQTVSSVLMRPTETFSKMRQTGGLANPLTYYVILGSLVGIVGIFYQLGLESQMGTFQAMLQHSAYHLPPETLHHSDMSGFRLLGGIFLVPAWCVMGAFIGAAIFHLMLMMVGGANQPFETTFRVYCYALGTSILFNLLPCCGWVIGLIWGMYILYVGIKEAHGIEGWKSLVAIALPVFFCCVLPLVLGIAGYAAYIANTGATLPH